MKNFYEHQNEVQEKFKKHYVNSIIEFEEIAIKLPLYDKYAIA